MAYNHADILSGSPYYDDFNDTEKFLRILFKPGYSVQARELTQLQTLLQNQISKFGSHVFKNGSIVFGGITTVTSCNFVRFSGMTATAVSNLFNYDENGIVTGGKVITSNTGAKAKVITVLSQTTQDNYTIVFLQYLSGNEFAVNQTFKIDGASYAFVVGGSTPTGTASLASTDEGIFYIDGFFIRNEKQSVPLYTTVSGIRNFTNPTNRIGFNVVRRTVSSLENSTLKDPANGSYNYNAPGADRYVIDLSLSAYTFNNLETTPDEYSTQDFIELARTINGKLDFIRNIPTYSDLIEIFARRTYDESGSYTVKPFGLEIKNHLRSDIYSFTISRIGTDIQTTSGTESPEAFNFSSVGNTAYLPPYANDILKIYRTDGKVYKLKIISSIPLFTGSSSTSVQITAKFTEDSDEIVPIVSGTQFIIFRANSSNYDIGVYYRANGASTVEQDETGVYSISETPKGNADKMVVGVQPGKAYVYGYEFENIDNVNISVDKPREYIGVTNTEINANIGNYFKVVTNANKKFNTYNDSFNINNFPEVNLKGKFVKYEIPKVVDNASEIDVIHWSPLFAAEHEDNFDSILFLGTVENNLSLEKELRAVLPAITSHGVSRPTEVSDDRMKIISQSINGSKTVKYTISDTSFETEDNISRLVFTEPYHGDFETQYLKDGSALSNTSEDNEEYSTDKSTFVYQINYLNQISVDENPSFLTLKNYINVKKGNSRRWVPAENSGFQSGSTLYINVPAGNNIVYGLSSSNTGFSLPDDNTTIESGVVFNSEIGSDISYGSSIQSAQIQNNIVEIILQEKTATGCADVDGPNPVAGNGKYTIGEVVTQTYTIANSDPALIKQASGTVISVSESSNAGSYKIYVEMEGGNDFVPYTSTAGYSDIKLLLGPCGCYTIKNVNSLDNSSCGYFTRISFRENSQYGDYTIGSKVFQYNIDYIPTSATSGNYDKCVAVGTVINWDASSRTLLLIQTQNEFTKKSGWIFEQTTGIKYGGRGWDKGQHNTTVNTTTTLTEISKNSGVFINISQSYVGQSSEYIDFTPTSVNGIKANQFYTVATQQFSENNRLYKGQEITQVRSGSTLVSKGRVVYFISDDVNDPSYSGAKTTIIIEPYSATSSDTQFVWQAGGISNPLRVGTNITYAVTGSATVTPENVAVIGSAKLRQLHRNSITDYTAHLFDVNMNFVENSTQKYSLNDTKVISDTSGNNIFTVEVETSGKAEIQLPQNNSLLFDLSFGDSIKNVDDLKYRIQKDFPLSLTGVSTELNTVITPTDLPATVRFIGGISGISPTAGLELGLIDSADLLKHYILIKENGQVYNLSDKTYFTSVITNNTDSGAISTLTINFKMNINAPYGTALGSGNFHLIATMSVNNSNIRTKTKSRKIKSLVFGSDGILTIPTADVLSIDSLTTSTGSSYNISYFEFNNGQTDNAYDYATLKLKNEYANVYNMENASVIVSYTYFDHGTDNGPIVVNSYNSYEDVPTHISPSTGQKIKLDSVIDFRPYKNESGQYSGIYGLPVITESFSADYSYYLAKNYKIVLSRDKKFKVLESASSITPVIPPDEPNSMTLFIVESPSYLWDINDLKNTSINHQRYTMNDIRYLEKRIEGLEYFTKLNLLEKTAQNEKIQDSDGYDLVKTSILVDGFVGHGIGDTLNSDYNISMDFENNILRPPFTTTSVNLELNCETDCSNLTKNGTTNLLTLAHTQSAFNVQPLCSTTLTINPVGSVLWWGSISMTPTGDSWYDTTKNPLILSNIDGENDAFKNLINQKKNNNYGSFGSKWNDWQLQWQGVTEEPLNPKNTKFGMNSISRDIKSRTPYSGKTRIGERTIDTDIVPFMRANTITVSATGMKPLTQMYVYFGGILVNSYCGGTSVLKSSTTGTLNFVFNLPAGKFRVGEKLLTIMDNNTNNKSLATTIAEQKYISSGINLNRDDYFVSTRPYTALPSGFTRETLLAQTFYVNPQNYPNGLYVKSVDIFFATGDTNNIPVKLQLRPVSMGFPVIGDNTISYPYATRILNSVRSLPNNGSNVPTTGTQDGTVQGNNTNFLFEAPVHLTPGEHAIVLSTNSSEYTVYAAEMGQLQLNSETTISKQPSSGKLFKSYNSSSWSELTNTDLMFSINKCVFSNAGTAILKEKMITGKAFTKYSTANLNLVYTDFNGLLNNIVLKTTNDATSTKIETPIKTNTNIDFTTTKQVTYDGTSVVVSLDLNSDADGNLTPVIDLDRAGLFAITNKITQSTNILEELDPVGTTAKARYITKLITMETGVFAENVNVYFKLNKPTNTSVDVYIKRQIQGDDKPINEQPYELLTENSVSNFVASSDDQFMEKSYTLPSNLDIKTFSKYLVKIVMYSSNSSIIPQIKDLRIVTVI